jgi:flagellar hook-associated protein 3 FlgL
VIHATVLTGEKNAMNIRVSLQSIVNQTLAETTQQTEQLAQLQAQASTGNSLQAPSDNPSVAAVVEAGTAQTNRLQSYLNNISALQPALNQSVSTLQDVANIFTQAKDIALQGAQSTNSAQTDGALAAQVSQLLSQLISDANTQTNGEYIYAGSATQTKPFAVTADAQGNPIQVTYQGAADDTQTTVGLNQTVSPYLSGSAVFQSTQGATASGNQPGGYDAFQTLIALRDTLQNTALSSANQATALSSLVGDIDRVNNTIGQATGQQAATVQSLSQLQNQVQQMQLSSKELVSNLGSADMSQVVVQMQATQNALQASLYGFAQILQQSLLEFIK